MKDNELLQLGDRTDAAVQGRPNPRHRILVVDHDSDLRLLYADALARPGYDVDTVEDGADGWQALRTKPFHLLITEYALPGLTGIELVRKLRAAHMTLPVVMASERSPADELARSPALHLAALLPKPFYISQLLETVREVLHAAEDDREQLDLRPNWRSRPPAPGLRL